MIKHFMGWFKTSFGIFIEVCCNKTYPLLPLEKGLLICHKSKVVVT